MMHVFNSLFHYLCKLALLVWELFPKSLGDLRPCGNPNALLGRDVLDKVL